MGFAGGSRPTGGRCRPTHAKPGLELYLPGRLFGLTTEQLDLGGFYQRAASRIIVGSPALNQGLSVAGFCGALPKVSRGDPFFISCWFVFLLLRVVSFPPPTDTAATADCSRQSVLENKQAAYTTVSVHIKKLRASASIKNSKSVATAVERSREPREWQRMNRGVHCVDFLIGKL